MPGTAAGWTGLDDRDVHGALPARDRLSHADLELVLGVRAFPGRVLGSELLQLGLDPGVAALATAAAEEGLEEVAEPPEPGTGPLSGPLRRLPSPCPGLGKRLLPVLAAVGLGPLDLLPVSSQAIVFRALLRVLQYLVGFVDPLESLSRLGVLVDVRVQLTGQLAISGPDLLVARRAGDP